MPVPVFTAGEVLTAANMNRIGLWEIAKFTATSGSAVACNNVFTADFDNYLVIISEARTSAAAGWNFVLNGATTGYYYGTITGTQAGSITGGGATNGSSVDIGVVNPDSGGAKIEFYQPFINTATYFHAMGCDARTGAATGPVRIAQGWLTSSSRTGFTINTSGITNMVVTVYGYGKA